MSNISIVRRIDDLGRLVIPKEMRKSLGIKEGDFIDINLTEDGVLIKPYNKHIIKFYSFIQSLHDAFIKCLKDEKYNGCMLFFDNKGQHIATNYGHTISNNILNKQAKEFLKENQDYKYYNNDLFIRLTCFKGDKTNEMNICAYVKSDANSSFTLTTVKTLAAIYHKHMLYSYNNI